MSGLSISCNSSTPIWNSVNPSCKITGTNFYLWFWTRELLFSQYSVNWLTMRFQSAEGISLVGSLSELAQPLFSLTPNRRATQAHTHTHTTPLPRSDSYCRPCHISMSVSPGSSPLPLPPPMPLRTVGRNRWIPAKQVTPDTEHTSVCPKWRHNTANMQTFRPKCQCWISYLQFC